MEFTVRKCNNGTLPNCFKSVEVPSTGAKTPDQNPETVTRMHIQRLDNLFRCSSYVDFVILSSCLCGLITSVGEERES